MNGPQPTDRYYRPEAIKSGYLGNERTETFLKGAGLFIAGVGVVCGSSLLTITPAAPVSPFGVFFGTIMMTRGTTLMLDSSILYES